MKVCLFTHTYPLAGSGEAAFLQTEIEYVSEEMTRLGITDFTVIPMSLSVVAAEDKVSLPWNISLNLSFVNARHDIRRYRRIIVLLSSFFHLNKLLVRRTSTLRSFKKDFITLLTWIDNRFVMKKVLKSKVLLDALDGALCYTYWSDGYTEILSQYLSQEENRLNSLGVVSRAHGGDVLSDQILQVNLRRRFDHVRQVFTTSSNLTHYLIEQGVPKDRLSVSRLGVDVNRYSSTVTSQSFKLLPSFQPDVHQLVVSISSDHPVKRLESLYQILSNCSTDSMPLYWLHLGASINHEFDNRADFAMNSVSYMPHSQILLLLKHLKSHHNPIMINFSLSEGVPISLVEGGLIGIPFIATNVGGSSSLFDDTMPGLIPKNPTTAELRWNLTKIASSYDELSQNVKRRMEVLFLPENTLGNFYLQLSLLADSPA